MRGLKNTDSSLEGVRIKMIKIEVNEGKIPWVVGIGTILFGILCIVPFVRYPDKSMRNGPLVCAVFAAIILAGIWMCFYAKNRKLVVEDESICYTNWLGRKTAFSLNDIAYCRAALENRGNRDYLKLYDVKDNILCKLEFNMTDSIIFLQYLLDNQIKVECSEKSDYFLKSTLQWHMMASISPEEIRDVVNAAYKEVKELVRKWTDDNGKFGVEWKTGILPFLEEEVSRKKQLWELKSCNVPLPYANVQDKPENPAVNLPEGYIIGVEGYLLKDGEFVIDKKGKAVCIYVPIISVSQSMKIGESMKISHLNYTVEQTSTLLAKLADALPRNRYHTEMLTLNHELKDSL